MSRWAAFLALAAVVTAQTARADDWGWRHHHHYYYPYGPRAEVIMVYPAPPPPPPPSVVYVPVPQPQLQPMQVVPTSQPYTDPYGRYCREYQGSVVVGGVAQPSYGTACRQPDGSWQIVSTR